MILGEAAWLIGFPPSRFHHLAIFLRKIQASVNLELTIRTDVNRAPLLFSAYLEDYLSAARAIELTKENTLPSTQIETVIFY